MTKFQRQQCLTSLRLLQPDQLINVFQYYSRKVKNDVKLKLLRGKENKTGIHLTFFNHKSIAMASKDTYIHGILKYCRQAIQDQRLEHLQQAIKHYNICLAEESCLRNRVLADRRQDNGRNAQKENDEKTENRAHSQGKCRKIPRLNLRLLPNYHGNHTLERNKMGESLPGVIEF